MALLKHPNIIRSFDHDIDATIVHPDGHKENVSYIALELGIYDLFDFVANGRFEEPLARFYFRQLIDAVYHIHKRV